MDPISDMLTRIRNAGAALVPVVELPHSRIKESVAKILKSSGYVSDVTVEGAVQKKLKIRLKFEGKKSVIEGLRRISSPGLRRYVGATEIPRVRGGLGIAVVSTTVLLEHAVRRHQVLSLEEAVHLMTDVQARKKNLGGELLCYVW